MSQRGIFELLPPSDTMGVDGVSSRRAGATSAARGGGVIEELVPSPPGSSARGMLADELAELSEPEVVRRVSVLVRTVAGRVVVVRVVFLRGSDSSR